MIMTGMMLQWAYLIPINYKFLLKHSVLRKI